MKATRPIVSIPNGKPGPLRRLCNVPAMILSNCFNPKREARPSQTIEAVILLLAGVVVSIPNGKPGPLRPNRGSGCQRPPFSFQSQTGSQALSDIDTARLLGWLVYVSIPNGKPGPLRHNCAGGSAGTGRSVSIPNGKPGPLRPRRACAFLPAHSCFNPKREARPSQTRTASDPIPTFSLFQSQTGSQALSDLLTAGVRSRLCNVSIPNGKPGPLRRCGCSVA